MQQSPEFKFDIVIVGGGMVGASLACALAESGLRIALVDAQPYGQKIQIPKDFDARVSAITEASRQFFVSLDVWDAIAAARCCAYTDMEVWEADGTGRIHFAAADIHARSLGHIIENSIILGALHQRLRSHKAVELIAPTKLAAMRESVPENCTYLELDDGRTLSARLVVAADGANSKVRELAGFETREWDYQHHAIVTTVKTEKPHKRAAIQRFMDKGVLAFLPPEGAGADAQHFCSIVWSVLPEYAQELMAQEDDDFAVSLQAAIESQLGRFKHLYADQPLPVRWLRNFGMSNLNNTVTLKNLVMRAAMGIE